MVKKKKILHVLKSNNYSGAENVVITICRNMCKDYDFVYVSVKGPIEQWLQEEQIEYCLLDKLNVDNLKKVIEQQKPDIIHAHDFSASVICAVCKGDAYVISHLHSNPPWIRKWSHKSIIYRLMIHRYHKILLVSEKIADEAVFFKKKENKLQIIGNPIDIAHIDKLSHEYESEKSDVLFLGRFSEPKNPKKFIRIMERICKVNPAVKAVMVGDGELLQECRSLVEKEGLLNNIRIIGFKKNPYPYIENTRIVLMPSEWEGYGLVAAESLLLEKPVLANAVGGLKSVLKDLPFGLCETENEMYEKAVLLLGKQGQYEIYVGKIRENKSKINKLDAYLNKMRKIYGE